MPLKPEPITGVQRLRGKVCDLPPAMLDVLALKVMHADRVPAQLVRAQRQVNESAQALRGGS